MDYLGNIYDGSVLCRMLPLPAMNMCLPAWLQALAPDRYDTLLLIARTILLEQ
jgi:hypothetical protein